MLPFLTNSNVFLFFYFSEVLPVVDFQSTLAMKIGLTVMSSLYVNACPQQYLQTLIGWLTGIQEDEECIMGTNNASLETPNDEQVRIITYLKKVPGMFCFSFRYYSKFASLSSILREVQKILSNSST